MLESTLRTLPRRPQPGRIELSQEGDRIVAQLMHDRLALPVVGVGAHFTEALHELRTEVERLAKKGRRRRGR